MRSPLVRLGRHHSVVAAYLALFTALGGSAYAMNTITGADIVDETIQAADIGAAAVTTDELAPAAVTVDQLRYDSVTGPKVVNGSPSSPDIANGSLFGYDIADKSITRADLALATVSRDSDSDPATTKTTTAYCPTGKSPVGGGGEIRRKAGDYGRGPDNLVSLTRSVPDNGGWTARADIIDYPAASAFTYTGAWVLRAWAICV